LGGSFQSVSVELAPGSRRLSLPFLESLNEDKGSFELGALHLDTNASVGEKCPFYPERLEEKT